MKIKWNGNLECGLVFPKKGLQATYYHDIWLLADVPRESGQSSY